MLNIRDIPQYYCYADDCPVRTEKEPWPRDDWHMGYVGRVSKKGNKYRQRAAVCDHCGKEMSRVASLFDDCD